MCKVRLSKGLKIHLNTNEMFGVNLFFAKGTNKYRFNIENYLFN